MPSIQAEFIETFSESYALAKQAKAVFPDGINSDSRYQELFPIAVKQADKAHKTTVEGRKLIDYWAGHGALLFGHNPPEVVRAVNQQMSLGTHYGACHPLELAWGKLIMDCMPFVEKVRFTNTGTEANLLAIQLAKSFTGKSKMVFLEGHYHGWLPPIHPTNIVDSHLSLNADRLILPSDLNIIEQTLKTNPDIACLVLEPTGACSGLIPISKVFLQKLRELTKVYGVVLIFDEVITGFRVAQGGAQTHYNIAPDLTILGKIVAGGLPGCALAGKKQLMSLLSFNETKGSSKLKTAHYGTFSGNPISAAAGIATIHKLMRQPPYEQLHRMASMLKEELNMLFESHQLDWVVYGEFSCLKFLIGHEISSLSAREFVASNIDPQILLKRGSHTTKKTLIQSLLMYGVDISLSSVITTAHTIEDIKETVTSFEKSIILMKKEGCI